MPKKTKTVETKKAPKKEKVASKESTAKEEFRAYMEDLRINAPNEYSDREVELQEKLNQL